MKSLGMRALGWLAAILMVLATPGLTMAQTTSASATAGVGHAKTSRQAAVASRRGASAKSGQPHTMPAQPTAPQLTINNFPPPPSPPRVAFRDRMLSIHAHNSTLGDVLSAVHQRTGAALDLPGNLTGGGERVTVDLGPAPAEQVLASLLNGSNFDYVILGRPEDASDVQLIMLREKSGGDAVASNGSNSGQPPQPGQIVPQTSVPPQETIEPAEDVPTAEIPDDAPPTPPDAEIQNQQNPDQTPKTPEQLLQELRQMQQQQQQGTQPQPPGQPQPQQQAPQPQMQGPVPAPAPQPPQPQEQEQ